MPVEIPIVHILLVGWNKTVAWSFTGLGIYEFLWIVGLSRSLMLRPVVVSDAGLEMNKGLLWQVSAPWADIVAVKRIRPTAAVSHPGFLNLAIGGPPDFVVELARPAIVRGPFGLTKRVASIGLIIDEAERFEKSVDSKLPIQL